MWIEITEKQKNAFGLILENIKNKKTWNMMKLSYTW